VGGEFAPPAAKDTLSGGTGRDLIDVFNRPAARDVVTCGGGFDRVRVDRADVVAPDCERVFTGLASGEAFFNMAQRFFEGLNPRVF
jgi:hypothetical protein